MNDAIFDHVGAHRRLLDHVGKVAFVHFRHSAAGMTLREYFRTNHFAPRLLTDYLAPMGAAIWSAPAGRR